MLRVFIEGVEVEVDTPAEALALIRAAQPRVLAGKDPPEKRPWGTGSVGQRPNGRWRATVREGGVRHSRSFSTREATEMAADAASLTDEEKIDEAEVKGSAQPPPEPEVPAASPTSKRDPVLQLSLQGKSVDEIAAALGMARTSVRSYQSWWRRRGELPPYQSAAPGPKGPDPVTPPAAPDSPPPAALDAGDDQEPDAEVEDAAATLEPSPATVDELRAEVDRQQAGQKSKTVFLATTRARKHDHQVKVDRFGDGNTVPDGSGHVHRVARFVVMTAHGHPHDLIVSRRDP